MYAPDTDTVELKIGYEKSLKEAKETIYEGRKAIEELTSSITQLVYEEDRRRREFAEVLATIQAVLNTVQNKSTTIYWRYNKNATLESSLKELNQEMLKATNLVSSSNIEEMKEVIEDLANWELNGQ